MSDEKPARLDWEPDEDDGWTLNVGSVLTLWVSAEYDEDCPNTYTWQVRGLIADERGFAATREDCERQAIEVAKGALLAALSALEPKL